MALNPTRMRYRKMTIAVLMALAVALGCLWTAGPAAAAEFGIVDGSFSTQAFDEQGNADTQAGAHPHSYTTKFTTNQNDNGGIAGYMRNTDVTLPPGLVGNPQALPKCPKADFAAIVPKTGACPVQSQIGLVRINYVFDIPGFPPLDLFGFEPVFSIKPSDGVAAELGFVVALVPVRLTATLGHDGEYRLVSSGKDISQGLPVKGVELTLWADPADPSHDMERGYASVETGLSCAKTNYDDPGSCPGQSVAGLFQRVPFLSNPTSCSGPQTSHLRMDSWENSGVFEEAFYTSPGMEGCDRLEFDPSMSVDMDSTEADGTSGLAVALRIPQSDDPDGLATAHLRRAEVSLPEGVSINPASADGLKACSDAQIGLGNTNPVACPAASKIGTVEATTPVLEETLTGGVYVGQQRSMDPGSGEMFRIFLELSSEERGIHVKLSGQVKVDPESGRITTVFDDNPQVPADRIVLKLKGGPRAPLALPDTCGTKTTDIRLSSWAGHEVELEDSFSVPCPAGGSFDPGFEAGSVSPVGGAFSPFVAMIDRREGDQYLSGVRVDMPQGVLAKLAGVGLCPDVVAGDGTPGSCPAGSRVGTATVGAGSGSPFYLSGPVYLTGPYKGAPYGLSVQVPAKAGPYDLGVVKVRQALHVDPETAQASVVSDPLPQVVKGVPVRLRSADVEIDRDDFTVNPTSCSEKQVHATLTSINGTSRKVAERFQVGDCRALGFTPRLSMRLVGRKQMRSGGHPVLRATLRQGSGQANIRAAKVTLPPNLVLDSGNTSGSGVVCDYDASLRADCPAHTVIGKASLRTPLLNRPLSGPLYLVQGIRISETGNRVRTLPTLLVKLRGEVSINLRSTTNTDSKDRLVSRFPNVPDARAGRFDIQINGGPKGILVVTENRRGRISLCNRKQTALVETDGHNGKRADYPTRVKTSCSKRKTRR